MHSTERFSDDRVLVVAPHPDDEIIGCGGLIAAVKEAGGSVFVLYMTVGNTADLSDDGFSTIDSRVNEIDKVVAKLGIDGYDIAFPGDEHHLRLDALPQHDLIGVLERTSSVSLHEIEPTMVLLPQLVSYNQDHRACAQAGLTALRPSAGLYKHQPRAVMFYEELADGWHAGTNAAPSVFVELSERQVRTKTASLELYETQVRPSPNARSSEALTALAECRGAQSGVRYAEAFYALRWLL